jgi:two-component system, response regulator YesN
MPATSPPHLLVVDDDPAVREALHTALADSYRVHTASTGAEALAYLREQPLAAVILDAVLGEEDGLALIEPFRNLSPAPILILTGHSSESMAIRAVWAKADGYLRKPVDSQLLRLTLARMLGPMTSRLDGLEQARRQLEYHPERAHTTKSLAALAGISERHFRRRFLEAHGKTPRRYLTETRLTRAADLLQKTALGIEQIAQIAGFPTLAAMDKLFKKAYRMSPTAFRAQVADRSASRRDSERLHGKG